MAQSHVILLESAQSPVRAVVTSHGASILKVEVPDANGRLADVVVGGNTLEDHKRNAACFGATCGRVANRIRNGRFSLNGEDYQIAVNNGPNALHGGAAPFGEREWSVENVIEIDGVCQGVTFLLESPDGDGGFPGALTVRATYLLSDDGELSVEYTAETDRPTVVNLTNHVYWNLSGDPESTVESHDLQVAASRYLPIDADHLATGEVLSVEGTPFDMRGGIDLGATLALDDVQIAPMRGLDHAMVIDGEGPRCALRLTDRTTGRWMEMLTNQPAVHVYTGGYLDATVPGKGGAEYRAYAGVALESENYPDAPNHPEFPSPVLNPGECYRHIIRWRFGC